MDQMCNTDLEKQFLTPLFKCDYLTSKCVKICHTYALIMKLGRIIPYLKKIQKKYKSRDTPINFC